ncbi:conjugal transfer protein TraO [Muricauda sp. SCSIO 64092]|uniref:conjugal transfer protein TraO n=1 Tax=Allomuricauda sp. SCSIO 64092 TaxID=2908842 RepID=UPI001FF64F64|nr:conjugal transfer protein TraO [Muricauda sp. SCSIO 64092]UOY05760.1 conjugal transfer protein TraO [Muricauda sp. SCSIO 64092]
MKNRTIIKTRFMLILFTGICFYAQSQNHSSAIEFLGGYSPHGIGIALNYDHHTSRTGFVQGGIYYSSNKAEVKESLKVSYNTFNVNIGYITNIYTSRLESIKLNIGGGGLIGYEEVNHGNGLLENGALLLDRSKFIYGGLALIELDIYINNDIGLVLRFSEYYHVNSDLGAFTLFAGVGVRYFLF